MKSSQWVDWDVGKGKLSAKEKQNIEPTHKLATNGLDLGNLRLPSPTGISEMKTCLEAIGKNPALFSEDNFKDRMDAIEFIECQVLGQLELMLQKTDDPDQLTVLKQGAENVRSRLEKTNVALFERLRENIRSKRYTENDFRNLIHEYVESDLNPVGQREAIGYDNLDIFLNGLSTFLPMPEPTKHLEPEMVHYQKTPARIILELAEKSTFTKEDVFFDLGSGLGQVAILVNLLSGVPARGVEFEPAFCQYASACASQLNLSNVTFIHADAREVDYSEGTVFFLYTPFEGKMLQTVLGILEKESRDRKIKIFTYGPCTIKVAEQGWLDFFGTDVNDLYALGVFHSR
ncbi:class I SAM-dependent methyltransferase [Chryseolinea soli]|uniref:Class I SAM-dependent methyltransferase n=1 Tax=Chryseolinea soli TaxID=2321403 RepID=A0A385SIF1_9BACT|nr:class I SAM-dependent methyltransferase [Chryseolinea soli]AYB29140.1 class I SAM-dependent methyltransferase [Chryseolinea soli]